MKWLYAQVENLSFNRSRGLTIDTINLQFFTAPFHPSLGWWRPLHPYPLGGPHLLIHSGGTRLLQYNNLSVCHCVFTRSVDTFLLYIITTKTKGGFFLFLSTNGRTCTWRCPHKHFNRATNHPTRFTLFCWLKVWASNAPRSTFTILNYSSEKHLVVKSKLKTETVTTGRLEAQRGKESASKVSGNAQ